MSSIPADHSASSEEDAERLADVEESDRRFRELADQLPAILWITTADGGLEFCNQRLEEFAGRAFEAVVGRAWLDMVHPDDRAATVAAWREAIRNDDDFAVEHRLRRADGHYCWHLSRGTAGHATDGRVARWWGISTDIHDRKVAEEAIQERESHFRGVFEHAHDAIVLFHPESWTILDANPAAEALYGWDRTELGRFSLLDLCEDQDQAREALAELEKEGAAQFELAQTTRAGAILRVEVNAAGMADAAGPGYLAIMRDVTERRELERQLQQAQKMEAIGRLAGGLAHDFNNLTTAIRGFATLLHDEITVEGAAAEALQEIDRAADRAADLTRQLLAYTRQQVLRPRTVDPNEVVLEGRRLLKRLIGEDIELETRLSPDVDPVRADPGQFQQVLMNLAINARDAMPEGGRITFETRNFVADREFADEHRPMEPGRWVELRMTDTGHGMEPAVRQRIFEPFFTTKAVGEGTGLGLSTVYGIIKQSGGFIWVESELGAGTTFIIHLPPVEGGVVERLADDDGPGLEAASLSASEKAAEPATILLVEDEDGVRKLTRRVLERFGYRVLEAANGQEGLELARATREPIDLLLTDMIMPRMSGKELARAVGERFPALPVLFMSGYTGESLHERGELEGVETVIEKPFRPAELARTVRELLERHRLGARSP